MNIKSTKCKGRTIWNVIIFLYLNKEILLALSSNSDSSPCLRGRIRGFNSAVFSFVCFPGLSDHLPNHLLEVFLRPKNYLEGPLATRTKTKQKHFIIVGGGMAGLTSAFLLLQVGHKVCNLLPSSAPVGNFSWNWAELALLSLFPSSSSRPTPPDPPGKVSKQPITAKVALSYLLC